MKSAPQRNTLKRLNDLLPVFPRSFSDCFFQAVWLKAFAWLLSKSTAGPSGLFPAKPAGLKPPGFKPWWLQELLKFSPSFQARSFGEAFFLCILLCSLLSSALPSNHSSFPFVRLWSDSPLNQVSAIPTFFYVASSLPLVVEFSSVSLQLNSKFF